MKFLTLLSSVPFEAEMILSQLKNIRKLKAGDIAIALKEIYGDDGVVTSRGWEGIKEIGIPLVQKGNKKYFNEFPLNPPA
jgi:hypothetical protein